MVYAILTAEQQHLIKILLIIALPIVDTEFIARIHNLINKLATISYENSHRESI